MKTMKKRTLSLLLCLALCLSLMPGIVLVSDAAGGQGTLRITTAPSGADVYVDGERYVQRTTPCTIPLEAGPHEITLRIPGYTEYCGQVTIAAGAETAMEQKLLPNLPNPKGLRVITVTTEADTEPQEELRYEMLADLDEVSLRQALTAAQNDPTDCWYRIEFAENVSRLELVNHTLDYDRDNLIINGDRDRDGTPDVNITQTNWSLLFRPMKNLYLAGLRLGDAKGNGCAIAIRPDDAVLADVTYENLYVLGCRFDNCEIIPFCGACKVFNARGKVDYININACGNELYNSNLFFAYSGNTDDSTTDGVRYCANRLDDASTLSVMGADCNTNYIFGGDNEDSNGGTPGAFETSDGNTVKNVLVSGNIGGHFTSAVAVNGNSRNTIRDVLLRNNYFVRSLHFRTNQPIDERNKGNRLVMVENVYENVTLEYNVLDYRADGTDNEFVYLTINGFDESDPATYYVLRDNVLRNFTMRNNLYLGSRYDRNVDIEEGIEYTLVSGMVPAQVLKDRDQEGVHYESENDRYEGLFFEGNRKVMDYDPYALWDDSPVHIHEPEYVPQQSPSCCEYGTKEYYLCSCGKAFLGWAGENEISDLSLWLQTAGRLDKLPHDFADADCNAPKTCINCGKTDGEPLGHSWGEGVITKAPTEKAEGERTFTCTRCGDSRVEAVPVKECPCGAFTDMPKYTNWAHAGIDFVVANKLMAGTSATAFSPRTTMSRAMLVTVLYRMDGEPGAGSSAFSDVPAGKWFSDAVSWAADNNIVSGVGSGKFSPNANVTREQIAAILFRYADFKGFSTDSAADLTAFADYSKVGSYAVSAMKWAVALDLVSGTPSGGKLCLDPKGPATREQVAAILMRFCQKVACS